MTADKKKESMARLRAQRSEWIARAKENLKRQSAAMKKIKAQLGGEGATIPEIAQSCEMPANEALWYVAAMRKYGQVIEGAKDGDYFRYVLAPQRD